MQTTSEKPMMLDDLRLVRKIAAGGMAEVWEARQTGVEGFEKKIAVKVILSNLSDNDEFIRMFLDEGRLAAQLDHPNVCQIFKMKRAENQDVYYMAMEYIDGVTLSTVVKESQRRSLLLPYEHCCQILIDACAGLDYAHALIDHEGRPLNLVHRDISPQNLMISFSGIVKVVDFGIAKAATQIHHTRAGVTKGKYSYMSPEQVMSEPLDRRSDIFALGVILWELSTGRRLFDAENEIAKLHKILGGNYDPPSHFREGYPPALDLIVMKALAPRPAERYQDCGEMQQALEDFLLSHRLVAGTKRLAHYIRFLIRGEEIPESQSSVVSNLFENSDPSLPSSTPSPTGRLEGSRAPTSSPKISPSSPSSVRGSSDYFDAVSLSGPTQAAGFVYDGPRPGDPKTRRSIWPLLLILLLATLGGTFLALFLLQPPPSPQGQIPQNQLTWEIRSTPYDAQIFLNGEENGRTPKILYFPPHKKLILRVSMQGYEPFIKTYENLTEKDVQKPLEISLKKEAADTTYGDLVLDVRTPRVTVVLDGERIKPAIGETGYLQKLQAGKPHTLLVERAGFETFTETVLLKADERKSLVIELKRKRSERPRPRRTDESSESGTSETSPPVEARSATPPRDRYELGCLFLTSSPSGATVYLNGQAIGKTPLSEHRLLPGSVKIKLAKDGYTSKEESLSFEPDETKRLSWRLSPLVREMGILRVGASPKSQVFVNGRFVGVTPLYNVKAPIGSARIEFREDRFRVSATKEVEVTTGVKSIFHQFQTGKLWVLTSPRSEILVNGIKIGSSNSPPYTIPVGVYTVQLLFPSGQKVEKTGTVISADKRQTIRHRFQP